jgi:hypothetical protein
MNDTIDVARIQEDPAYKEELRWRAQTDLLWLAKHVLGYSLIDEHDHREIADMFIEKDPTKPIEEQSEIKVRIILMPRRTFKTTFNIADTVQWILGFPDVAVMAMTASNSPDSPLADAFVMECAMHFYVAPGAPLKPLHLLFPEHVLSKIPKAGEFNTPARTHYRRDPTVKGVSIEQSLSGWHPDVLKGEDIQDNRNSQTSFALQKVWKNLQINIKMLAEWAYRDHTGTRYGPADVYSRMLVNPGPRTKILWKPAYVRFPHALSIEDDDLTEGDVILQFPRLLSWEYLRSVKIDDEDTFWTQYMNIAQGNFKPTFPQEKLEAAKVSAEHAPDEHKAHIAWRFEYAECKHAAGAVGIERDGRITIVEVLRGMFVPTQLARRVVLTAKKWETHRVEIEDTPGARTMVPHIRNVALENDWRIELSWGDFLQDDTARALAIKSAEPHLLGGRLLFADDLQNGAELFRQLYQFGMVDEFELASVVSRVANKLPASIAAEGFEAQDEEMFAKYVEEDAYNRVYGRGRYKDEEPAPEMPGEEWEPAEPGAGLSDMMPGLTG